MGPSEPQTGYGNVQTMAAVEDDTRIRIRLRHRTYQSEMETPTTWPYGFFVLPRREGKDYLLEENRQRYLGGPPIWREAARLQIEG